jgi:hypothetical protein
MTKKAKRSLTIANTTIVSFPKFSMGERQRKIPIDKNMQEVDRKAFAIDKEERYEY